MKVPFRIYANVAGNLDWPLIFEGELPPREAIATAEGAVCRDFDRARIYRGRDTAVLFYETIGGW